MKCLILISFCLQLLRFLTRIKKFYFEITPILPFIKIIIFYFKFLSTVVVDLIITIWQTLPYFDDNRRDSDSKYYFIFTLCYFTVYIWLWSLHFYKYDHLLKEIISFTHSDKNCFIIYNCWIVFLLQILRKIPIFLF